MSRSLASEATEDGYYPEEVQVSEPFLYPMQLSTSTSTSACGLLSGHLRRDGLQELSDLGIGFVQKHSGGGLTSIGGTSD